jgi:hypothetical protein
LTAKWIAPNPVARAHGLRVRILCGEATTQQ